MMSSFPLLLDRRHLPGKMPDRIPANPDLLGQVFRPVSETAPDTRGILATDLLVLVCGDEVPVNGFDVLGDVEYGAHKWLASGDAPAYAVRLFRAAMSDSPEEWASRVPLSEEAVGELQDAFHPVEADGELRAAALDAHASRGDTCSPVDAVIAHRLRDLGDRYVATWSADDHRQYWSDVVAVPTVDVDSMDVGGAIDGVTHPLYVRR